MRKLFALLTVVFFAGFLMAQNTSTATQSGPNNNATVDQTGTGNASTLLQESDIYLPNGMTADIDQVGIENTSDVYQGKYGQHYATVNQEGRYNNAQVESFRNNETAWIHQDGNYNDAYQMLHGNFGTTNIEQIGNRNTSDQQIGIYGTAGINNSFSGYQEGNHNTVTQHLSTDFDFASTENTGEVTQLGNQNISEQYIGTVTTISSYNQSVAKINGDMNRTEQSQFGNDNASTVKVGFQSSPTYASDNNNVKTFQTGNSNTASFGLTWGDDNISRIRQTGDNNYTEISIKYGDDNSMKENATGNSNRTRLGIEAPWGSSSDANVVDIRKNGDANYVSGYILGDGNMVDIVQHGNDNRVGTDWYTGDGVNIDGNNNMVTVSQVNDGHMSLNTVTGDNNNITVTQH